MLYPDYGSGYATMNVCQKSWNRTLLEWILPYVNFTSVNLTFKTRIRKRKPLLSCHFSWKYFFPLLFSAWHLISLQKLNGHSLWYASIFMITILGLTHGCLCLFSQHTSLPEDFSPKAASSCLKSQLTRRLKKIVGRGKERKNEREKDTLFITVFFCHSVNTKANLNY